MSANRPQVRIGISGWRYEPWRGVFYPKGLPQRLELPYAAHNFNSIEINGSFYSLQAPSNWSAWYASTPARFVFSVKGPRFITHMLKLKEVEQPLANFFASGLLVLREKLGPILWQFAPWLKFRPKRFERFFAMLPHDTEAALRLARRRHPRMHGRSVLAIDAVRSVRHAVEIRNASFLDRRFIELLREHRVALVVAETARTWPMPRDVTADFMYLRLHGDRKMYQSGYSSKSLDRWAKAIRAWRRGREPRALPPDAVRVCAAAPARPQGRDVFCYFDNTDVKLRAPADARGLMDRLGLARAYDAAALMDLLRRRNGR
ncbi:MAG TPA: DUF72 domain-containing protein [Candidatus Polarisedimenticolia bacterium]|jgi:uncharacterized protein YecE (DUF72 family)|nr:DUF72 domain-containing protein [Candidatus Polarisedimenticolia bacterium]